jgi:hypothetical protein
MGAAESHLTEDGGNRVMFIDRRTGSLRGMAELRLGTGPICADRLPEVRRCDRSHDSSDE